MVSFEAEDDAYTEQNEPSRLDQRENAYVNEADERELKMYKQFFHQNNQQVGIN